MKWLIAAFALAVVVGLESWTFKQQTEKVCRSAAELAAYAGSVSSWIAEAKADPFLESEALREPMSSLIATYRDRSRWILSEFSTIVLPEQALAAFQELSRAGDLSRLSPALTAVAELGRFMNCGVAADSEQASELTRKVREGREFWQSRKELVAQLKKEFAADAMIYCRSDDLLQGLGRVVSAREGRCRDSAAKQRDACREGPSEALHGEIADLEKQKEFNMKKLRQKWPESVLKGLACTSS